MALKSRRGAAFIALAAALVLSQAACGGRAGRAAAAPGGAAQGAPLQVAAGELRGLDAFPLFELRYGPAYDLGAMVASLQRGEVRVAEGEVPGKAFACTCFAALDEVGHRVMGRNFDWDPHPVLVLFTAPKDGYASVSLVDIHYLGYSATRSPLDSPEALINAPALPFDGMNEKGVAVGMMAVPHAEGGADAALPTVSDLGLIRLILDRAASLDEALALARGRNVRFDAVPLHYFIAERGGASAVVEYVGGMAVVHRAEKAWQVSTNFLLSEVAAKDRPAACRRYAAAEARLSVGTGRLSAPEGSGTAGGASGATKRAGAAFALLEEVSQPSTRWSAVYDLDAATLSLALGRDWARRWDWSLPPR